MKRYFPLLLLIISTFTFAQVEDKKLDELIKNTLTTFDVPGMSVGILKDGKLIYAKGFGVQSLTTKKAMNENTLVGIASNSKGFTATALAILVDEGKLKWDDKVSKFIPEFKMYTDYATQEITVKDLLTHRAGLGLGQGDLMFFPEGGTLSVQDIIQNVRYLKPDYSFRNKMEYNNVMFIVAGEVIHRISGLEWADFIEQKIMKPVGMNSSFGSYNRAKNITNKIDAHAPINGKAVQVPHDWNETANAAGGIMSNITDMAIWADFLMNGFTTKDGKKLVSDKQIQELWQIQKPMTVALKNPYDTHFYGYGLGWFLSDVKGQFQVQHTGGLIGTVTQFTLLPDLKLGIIVLTNQQSGAAFNTITNTVKDAYLGISDRNWLQTYGERMQNYNAGIEKGKDEVFIDSAVFAKSGKLPKEKQYMGTYKDLWFGNVDLVNEKGNRRIYCRTSPKLKGTLLPYSIDTFIIQWDDFSYDADAFITFEFDEKGNAKSAKMKPISDVTDFSFDFGDLDLQRVK